MGQPLLLADPSNVAILWGFIIGPKCFVVGALLGGLSVLLHLNTKQNLHFLAIAAIIAAVVAVYLTVAGYRETIRLVDAEIVACEQVDRLLANQTKMWSKVVAVRPNWVQEIPDMVRARPGAVLTMRIYQEAWVREQKWRWGGISKRVDNWKNINETKQVFAPITDPISTSSCERFVIGERRFSALTYEHSNPTPPEKLPAFLWLFVLQPVPPEYIRYLPK